MKGLKEAISGFTIILFMLCIISVMNSSQNHTSEAISTVAENVEGIETALEDAESEFLANPSILPAQIQTSEPTKVPPFVYKENSKPQSNIYIDGNVNTGDDYIITNESQKIDYSVTIIIVVAIIIIPIFILGMTVLILMHKKAEREHAEKVLATNIPTYHEQEISELKNKYKQEAIK